MVFIFFFCSRYPTFILYKSDLKTSERYTDDRDIDSFVEFIQSKYDTNVLYFL